MILALVHSINNDGADELLCQGLTLLAHSPSLPAQKAAGDKFWTKKPSRHPTQLPRVGPQEHTLLVLHPNFKPSIMHCQCRRAGEACGTGEQPGTAEAHDG